MKAVSYLPIEWMM